MPAEQIIPLMSSGSLVLILASAPGPARAAVKVDQLPLIAGALTFVLAALALLVLLAWRSARERRGLLETIKKLGEQADALKAVATRPAPKNELESRPRSVDEVGDSVFPTTNDLDQPSSRLLLKPPDNLVEACARGGTLLFIGDSAMVREGAPSREQFLRDAAISGYDDLPLEVRQLLPTGFAIERLLRRAELDAAAERLERQLGRDALLSKASDAYAQARPIAGLEALCRTVDFQGFVSLAFDPAARRAIGVEGTRVLTARSSENFEQLVTESGRFLLQLAGDLDHPGTVCLTSAELKATIAEAPDLRSTLLSMITAKTVLFVGLSAHDIETLWDIVGMLGASSQTHYALMHGDPDFDLIAERFRVRYNTELIELRSRDELGVFADALGRATSARRREFSNGDAVATPPSGLLRRLTLQNIGPFAEASVAFAPSWTVILGNNGAGKSTILRAIALVLAGTDRDAQAVARTLLKRGKKFGSVELEVDAVPQPVTYKAQITLEGDRVNLSASVSPLQAGTLAAFGFSAIRGVVPLYVMEPTAPAEGPVPRVSDVLPLLRGGLDERVLDLRAWIRQTYAVQQDASLPERERARAAAKLDSLFKVVDEMAPGFDLRFSRCDEKGEILLMTSDGELPISLVSQGMTSMIGWLGTLIQRLHDLGTCDADPRQTQALVLVDEIDGHLHPEWQQLLVPTLRRTFPGLQVVATTHSALMVGSLEKGEAVKVSRVGGELAIENIQRSYKGYRVDQILTDPPFDMSSTRDLDWEALRAEYAKLLGKSSRTLEQEARYLDLDALMDEVPPPYEQRASRAGFDDARERVDAEISEAALQGKPAGSRS